MPDQSPSRRDFAKTTTSLLAGAAVVPYYFAPTSVLAQESKSKNDRFRTAMIGCGGMGRGNMHAAKQWCDVVAVCDVDARRANEANHTLSGGKADVYHDYRAILDRDDYEVLHIATPDHWHTKPLVEALKAGKDVYCEKPMTLTIDEGKLIRKVQKETGRIVQVGTQQRSTFNLFVKAIAMVAEGRVGKIKKVQAAIDGAPKSPALPVAKTASAFDWERWLGPAPLVDYRALKREGRRPLSNGHYEFRWWYEYSGGKLTDWGAHHVDIAVWALQANGQSGIPISIGGTAEHPVPFENGMPTQNDRYNTATKFKLSAMFPDDVELIIRSDTDNGVLIEGDKGRIFVSRGKLAGKPVEDLADNPLPEDAISKVYKGLPIEFNERKAHWANFLHCVRERKEPISDVHSHMEALNVCHLAGIAARLGRTIQWDGQAEQITVDDQANSMLSRPYREGYEIEM